MYPANDMDTERGNHLQERKTAAPKAEEYITKEKLDSFQFPLNSCLVIYDTNTRKAMFFRKTENGYRRFLTRNKRADPISIRINDYVLTVNYAKELIPGDLRNVFERKE